MGNFLKRCGGKWEKDIKRTTKIDINAKHKVQNPILNIWNNNLGLDQDGIHRALLLS